MAPSASDVAGVLPSLRAFAVCIAGDEEQADALVEVVLARAWKNDRHVADDDTRLVLFNLMHREFHGYEAARIMAHLPDPSATQPPPSSSSDGAVARSLLRGLPPAEREAIVLLGACGFSELNTAAICESDLWTIRRRVRGASAKLSRALHPKRSAGKPALRLRQAC